jgi:hypothetical protein
VPEKTRLDVFRLQGAAKERVVHEIDLTRAQKVGRSEIPVELSPLGGLSRSWDLGPGEITHFFPFGYWP